MKNAKPLMQKVLSLLEDKHHKIRLKKETPLLEQSILLILQKDFGMDAAQASLDKLRKDNVDWNELRVSSIPEIAEMLTPLRKDPIMIVKVQALKEFLNQVFNIRHSLNMEFLRKESKERQLKILSSLECLEPYQVEVILLQCAEDKEDLPHSAPISRVLQRIGIASKSSAVGKQREDIEALAPDKDVANFYGLLARHAEEVCNAKSPRCSECCLKSLCKYGKSQAEPEKVSA